MVEISRDGKRTALYFRDLEPPFDSVRRDCDRLLRLNQDAMRRKADAASRTARRWRVVTVALALTGYLSAVSGEAPRLPAILRNVGGGLLAMLVTYLIGGVVGGIKGG